MSHFKGCSADVHGFDFPTHGRVDLVIDGSKAIYRVEGPFNSQLIQALRSIEEGALAVGAFKCVRVIMVIFERCALASPKVLEILKQHAAEQLTKGIAPTAVAFVLASNVEGGKLMTPIYQRLFSDIGLNFCAFETEYEAKSWVDKHLADH